MSNQRVQLPEVFSSKNSTFCSFTVIPAGAFLCGVRALVGLKTSKCIEQTYS